MTPAGAPNRLTPPKTELRYVHRPSQGRRPAVNVSPLKLWQRFPAVWSLLVHRPPPSSSSLSNDAPCALHCGITALVTRRVHTAGCVTTTSLWLPVWRLVQPATYSVIIIIIIIGVVVVGNGLEVDTSTIDLKMNVILGYFFFNLNQHLFKRTHVYL